MITRRMIGAIGALILATGVLALASPAQATQAVDCKTVAVDLTGRPDSGVKGNNWALNDMTRTMKVCALADPVEGAEPGTLSWYTATVTDGGTFVTQAGDSPAGTATLAGGMKGKVTGDFTATFTATASWGDYNADALKDKTPTAEWVATAFPGARFNDAGPVAKWSWTYTTCDGKGETWVNADAGNSGDIAEAACPTAGPTTPPATDPTTDPTVPATAPAAGGGGGSLPVTGAKVATVVSLGFGAVIFGVLLVAGAVRRRRTMFEA